MYGGHDNACITVTCNARSNGIVVDRERWRETSGLDPRSFAIAKIAALIALDAPPASYQWQVENAVAAGVSPKDILGVLFAIAPQVGGPRVVAAAPEIMLALGLPLPAEPPDADSAI